MSTSTSNSTTAVPLQNVLWVGEKYCVSSRPAFMPSGSEKPGMPCEKRASSARPMLFAGSPMCVTRELLSSSSSGSHDIRKAASFKIRTRTSAKPDRRNCLPSR